MKAIPIYYRPEQTANNATSFSPSAGKPAAAVESWQALGIPLSIEAFAPVTRPQIKRAHDPAFVDDLLDCKISNGFGNRSPAVAASLPYTSGSMLAAAREAMRNGVGAVSPTSGFHHAGHGYAGGFCSLNGLMVAALNLPPGTRVGILDADYHLPDGVLDIVDRLRLDLPIVHVCGTPASAERWIAKLPALIVERFIDCDLLLYQAGADAHIDDPLGGWMTDDQLRRRDRAVFGICRAIGLPVAWNFAGGYRRDAAGSIRPVLDIHDATMQECAEAWI